MDTEWREKPRPPDETCPQCKEDILWRRCGFCNAIGTQEIGTMKSRCLACKGKGWVKDIHICVPKTPIPEWSGMFRSDQTFGRTGFGDSPFAGSRGKENATSAAPGSGRRRRSSSHGWVVVILVLLVVGVVFVPELRELMRVILVALWALLLDLFAWLADAIRSLTG